MSSQLESTPPGSVQPLDPALAPYLSCNQPLTNHLQRLAKERIAMEQHRIRAAMDEVERLRKKIRQMEGLIDGAAQNEERYAFITSPIRLLPSELVLEVLKAVLPAGCVLGREDRIELMHLRSVCRHWRGIILSSSSFWRGLVIEAESVQHQIFRMGFMKTTQPLVTADHISRWFDRAGKDAHLTLILKPAPETADEEGAHGASIWRLAEYTAEFMSVVSKKRRWRKIQLPLGMSGVSNVSLHLLSKVARNHPSPWEHLHTLHIDLDISSRGDWPFNEESPTFASTLPNLKTLALIWNGPNPVPISHPGVSSLCIAFGENVPVDCGLSIISQFPALQSLSLEIVDHPGTPPEFEAPSHETEQTVQLVQLCCLTLTETDSIASYLDHFILPAVRYIGLKRPTVTTPASPDIEPFVSLVHRSHTLKTLNVFISRFDSPDIADVIFSANNLTTLFVADWSFLDVFLKDKKYRKIKDFVPLRSVTRIWHPKFPEDGGHFDSLKRFFQARFRRMKKECERLGPDIQSHLPFSPLLISYDSGPDLEVEFSEEQNELRGYGVRLERRPWMKQCGGS